MFIEHLGEVAGDIERRNNLNVVLRGKYEQLGQLVLGQVLIAEDFWMGLALEADSSITVAHWTPPEEARDCRRVRVP